MDPKTAPPDFEQLPLKDIHLPDPVSWWPPAPGWWLVLLLLAVAALAAWWWFFRCHAERRRRRLVFREARRALARIEADYAASRDPDHVLQQVSILVRRVALSLYPRRQVAGLCGTPWVQWLARAAGGVRTLEVLQDGPYRRNRENEAVQAVAHCRQWLQTAARRPPVGSQP